MGEERKLYKEGDEVDLEFQTYPGPKPFKTTGRVVKCLSPTYYAIEYVDQKGNKRTRNLTRNMLN